eukprot:s33_g43.t1
MHSASFLPQHADEEEVGISEHLCPDVPGFPGHFKTRWQDFHVHEVDLDGVELHLTELITPGAVAAELKRDAEERREARNSLGSNFVFETETETELEDAVGPTFSKELLGFLQQQAPRSSEIPAEVTAPPSYVDFNAADIKDGSKEARKKAHEVILKHFGSFLNTETVESSGARMLRVWMREAEKKAKEPTASEQQGTGDGAKGRKGKGKGGKDKKGRGKKKGEKGGGQVNLNCLWAYGTHHDLMNKRCGQLPSGPVLDGLRSCTRNFAVTWSQLAARVFRPNSYAARLVRSAKKVNCILHRQCTLVASNCILLGQAMRATAEDTTVRHTSKSCIGY